MISLLLAAFPLAFSSPQDKDKKRPSADEPLTMIRQARNPLTDLITVPFQNNINFGVGPGDDVQNVLNIQPIIPISLGEWSLVTRTIIPVIHQPEIIPGTGTTDGLGDINFSAFLSPAGSTAFRWGVGPAFLLPTATENLLGTQKYSLGPAAAALAIEGPWIAGAVANNVWSFSGTRRRADVNRMLLQPFVFYSVGEGWYLTSAPLITANWEAPEDERWTIPVGGGLGKVVRVGELPLNFQLAAYDNVRHPKLGAEWTLQFQILILLPK